MSDFELFYDLALAALRRDRLAAVDWREAEPAATGLAALCRAQGRLAAPSSAVGELGLAAGAVEHDGRFDVAVLPGNADRVAFACGGRWFSAAVADNERGLAIDPLVSRIVVTREAAEPIATPEELPLAYLGAAFDLLGCCDALIDMAVEYARDRQQFGRPIGNFQAVQHLLAESHVQREGLRALCFASLESIEVATLAKAYGGAVAGRVAQATLQVFGAIGFTMEHDHQRYYRRAMVLDAAFASSRELFRSLGERCGGGAIDRLVFIDAPED